MFKFAENLLNNLDQTAQTTVQTALNEKKNTVNNNKGLQKKAPKKHAKNKSLTVNQVESDVPNLPTTSISASNSTANLTSQKTTKLQKQEDDLFENFLNSSDVVDTKINTPKSDTEVSNDNVSFMIGDKSNKPSDNESLSGSFEVKDSVASEKSVQENDLELDNEDNKNELEYYKTEIEDLKEEKVALMKQIKTTQNDYQRARKKLENFQNVAAESDKVVRELRSREEDLNEAIKSKDSQLAVLRVRFTEQEGELDTKRKEIERIQSESDRILTDHTNSSDIQSQAFESLKIKLKDLEENLDKEKEITSQAQKEYMSMQSKLEFDKQNLYDQLQSVEKKLSVEKAKNSEHAAQLKNQQSKLKESSNHLKQELEDYKLKATKTLQAKDRIIAQLKETSVNSGEGADAGSEGVPSMRLIEIEELKGERDYLRDELDSKASSIELLKAEIIELESQTSIEIETLKDQQRSLIEEQEEHKQSKSYFEQDLKSIRQQLDYAQNELYKQKSTSKNQLGEREAEIEKLRAQLTTKNLGTTTEKELENRLHMLTENLIQKQTLIEALQSEKHSIFLQLERSEKRLEDYEKIVSSKNSVSLRMHDDEDPLISTPGGKNPIFRESPYDHEVTRKVKRAATEIDKFSIRLGVFLKKYPIARIFVLFYMFLLHLWVVVVLFTYTPEAHDSSYNHHQSAGSVVMPHLPNAN